MKLKHWVFLGLGAVGALFLLHLWLSHGGIPGLKQGTGFGGMGGGR